MSFLMEVTNIFKLQTWRSIVEIGKYLNSRDYEQQQLSSARNEKKINQRRARQRQMWMEISGSEQEAVKPVGTQIQAESKAYRAQVELPSISCSADAENRLLNMLVGGSKVIRCHKKWFLFPRRTVLDMWRCLPVSAESKDRIQRENQHSCYLQIGSQGKKIKSYLRKQEVAYCIW